MIRTSSLIALPLALLMAGCADSPAPANGDSATEDAATTAPESETTMEPDPDRLEIQGHRGARGLLPENTVPGFVLAIREGADVLEMDLCIAGDGAIIVSHEPWMNHEICLSPEGRDISLRTERTHNLHQMTTSEIEQYDCGSRVHPRFPDQRTLPVPKPTLAKVVSVTETVPLLDGGTLRYNLEIKHRPDLEPEFCPDPETFASLVLDEVNRLGIAERTCIQSFSPEVMEAVHRLAPDMTTAWLSDAEGSVQSQLDRLTFQPDIYSPAWQRIDSADVSALQALGIRVIPWTVNNEEDLVNVMAMGVDGIITDHPDRLYDMR
jgi:glycerophosphoryl diester phosphodiesterase